MSSEAEQLRAALEQAERDRDESRRAATEARARESAVTELLGVISQASTDLQPVFDTVTRLAMGLTDSSSAFITRIQGDKAGIVAAAGSQFAAHPPTIESPAWLPPERATIHVDMLRKGATNHGYGGPAEFVRQITGSAASAAFLAASNVGSAVSVPLHVSGSPWGTLSVLRASLAPYTGEQIALLQTFAAQAVLAIENAGLLAELRDRNGEVSAAFEQQKALADVLNVIASSATDAKPVLEAILDTGTRMCAADGGCAFIVSGDRLQIVAGNGFLARLAEDTRAAWPIDDSSATGQSIQQRRTVLMSRKEHQTYSNTAFVTAEYGVQYTIAAPLLRGDRALGALAFSRKADEEFTPQQVALIETFADQAVIAVENARLFNELQARNAEITEALRREAASSAILRQISNAPEALDATLHTIAEAAQRLTGMSSVVLLLDENQQVMIRGLARIEGELPGRALGEPSLLNGSSEYGQLLQSSEVRIFGWKELQEADWARSRDGGVRTAAYAPIRRGEVMLGFLAVTTDTESPITTQMGALMQSFADQAAIAIENARLIRELRESNRAISENLDIQRVMGEVLAVVASAPTSVATTLARISEAGQQLCAADGVSIAWHHEGAVFVYAPEVGVTDLQSHRLPRGSFEQAVLHAAATLEYVGSADDVARRYPSVSKLWKRLGYTDIALLGVPLVGAGGVIGAISANRKHATPFSERQRSVLLALATQAQVAIENARLFTQLRAKTEELEVASRHKSEFLANMSHELRTPLNAIIGYAELLQEECEDLGQEDFLPDLGKIHSAGKHLLTLISGILDLSKVEAGRMTMFLEDFDIATLIRDADAIVRPLVEKNRNRFVIDVAPDIGTMHADLVKVRQVLFNLLSNSAKFTEGGEIMLTVRAHPASATITFAIRDTGIGMTEEQLGRLFEAFSQANAETSRKYGGTGLGLALSREFCRMMGGDITVESVPGAGSTFTVTLPITCVDPEADA